MTYEQYLAERKRIIALYGGDGAAERLNKLRLANPEHSSIPVVPFKEYKFIH